MTFNITTDTDSLLLNTQSSLEEKINKLLSLHTTLKNPTQYIVLNKSIILSSGKAVAQAVHAQEALLTKMSEKEVASHFSYSSHNPRTVIVLQAYENEIKALSQYLDSCHIKNAIYVDEGNTRDYILSPTALATEYLEKDSAQTLVFKNFELYSAYDKLIFNKYIELILDKKVRNKRKLELLKKWAEEDGIIR